MDRVAFMRRSRALPSSMLATAPPTDWRMPAVATTNISGASTALNAAQASSSSKSRPSVSVADGETKYIEWTVAEAGTLLYSQIANFGGNLTTTLTLNGVDQGTIIRGNEDQMRQGKALIVEAGDLVRITWTASGASRQIYPLLHKLPASGPWDAWLVIGASREYAQRSLAVETEIIGEFSNRDPVIFNRGSNSIDLATIASQSATIAPSYEGQACYVLFGSVMGNTITAGRPYDIREKTAIDTDLATLRDAYTNYTKVFWASTSYRKYSTSPVVTPSDQSGGSLPYNENVLHPYLSANFPDTYDSDLKRSRIDEYLQVLRYRDELTDDVHGAYDRVRALWVDTAFRYVYTGSWGTSQAAQRVATVEGYVTAEDYGGTAQASVNEAEYALSALAASSAKAALQARLTAGKQVLLLGYADALVTVAEASPSQPGIDAAQAAIDAADAAGADATALQARLDLVEPPAAGTTVRIWHYGQSTGLPAGWNKGNENFAAGPRLLNGSLTDTEGSAVSWEYWDTGSDASTRWSSGTTNVAQVSSIAWIPDSITTKALYANGTQPRWEIRGLDDTKVYDIKLYAARVGGTGRNVIYTVQGVEQAQFDAGNNVTAYATVTGVAPTGGIITFSARQGSPTNGYAYLTATEIQERAP